jgi:hypothetical protein
VTALVVFVSVPRSRLCVLPAQSQHLHVERARRINSRDLSAQVRLGARCARELWWCVSLCLRVLPQHYTSGPLILIHPCVMRLQYWWIHGGCRTRVACVTDADTLKEGLRARHTMPLQQMSLSSCDMLSIDATCYSRGCAAHAAGSLRLQQITATNSATTSKLQCWTSCRRGTGSSTITRWASSQVSSLALCITPACVGALV